MQGALEAGPLEEQGPVFAEHPPGAGQANGDLTEALEAAQFEADGGVEPRRRGSGLSGAKGLRVEVIPQEAASPEQGQARCEEQQHPAGIPSHGCSTVRGSRPRRRQPGSWRTRPWGVRPIQPWRMSQGS